MASTLTELRPLAWGCAAIAVMATSMPF